MKTRIISLLAFATAIISLWSCHAGGTAYDADQKEGYAEAVKLILKSVDPATEKVYYMKFECSQEHGNRLETLSIKVVSDKDMAYSLKILLTGNCQALPMEHIPHTFEAPIYKDVKGIDITHFDAGKVLDQINQAKKLIPEGGKFKAIYDYTISEVVPAGDEAFNDSEEIGKVTTSFFLSFTRKSPDGQEGFAAVRCLVDPTTDKVRFDQ